MAIYVQNHVCPDTFLYSCIIEYLNKDRGDGEHDDITFESHGNCGDLLW